MIFFVMLDVIPQGINFHKQEDLQLL